MKVFITGATGYIGFAVAKAFRRAGHEVWGLTRSQDKAALLARAEIHPVIGSMQEPKSWAAAAEQASVLIHAAVDYQADTATLDRQTAEALIALGQRGARPKQIIYTSGVWVHGNTQGQRVDESTPLTPARFVARRPETEQLVLSAANVHGVVVRPGCVYGKQGGLTGLWFSGAAENALRVIGDGKNRWAMVHVDDLAEAYLRVAEGNFANEIFNLTDGSTTTVTELATAVAQAASYRGKIEYVPLETARQQMGDFADCLALDQLVDAGKAERLLDWRPRHRGFVANAPLYYNAWRASRE